MAASVSGVVTGGLTLAMASKGGPEVPEPGRTDPIIRRRPGRIPFLPLGVGVEIPHQKGAACLRWQNLMKELIHL
jgi:hypothetical protein